MYELISMDNTIIPLSTLHQNQKAKIVRLEGGHGFQRKLRVMGVREGQIIMIITRQPFRGPFTIQTNGCQMTLGRGMAQKILVEKV
jgi:ferrous iron transport protein A